MNLFICRDVEKHSGFLVHVMYITSSNSWYSFSLIIIRKLCREWRIFRKKHRNPRKVAPFGILFFSRELRQAQHYMPFYSTLHMTRHLFLLPIIFLLNLSFSFGQSSPVDTNINTDTIAILNYNEGEFPFLKNCTQVNVSSDEVFVAETLLQKFISEYNKEQTRQYNSFTPEQQKGHILFLLDLKSFRRQYVPVINQSGEKEIWVNCFCNSLDKDWKKEVIKSSGERMCNFKIMLNLTLNKYHDFRLLPLKNGI
jgi:hypothetical protein